VQGQEYRVDYLPAESNTGMFGGNSNCRGPVWMPVNAMIVRALLNFYLYYGDNFKINTPRLREDDEPLRGEQGDSVGSAGYSCRMSAAGDPYTAARRSSRPILAGATTSSSDHILFYEYFHGDNGAGLGASHQTGWTGLVAKFIQLLRLLDAERLLEGGKKSAFAKD
jgi:hypothetical protein